MFAHFTITIDIGMAVTDTTILENLRQGDGENFPGVGALLAENWVQCRAAAELSWNGQKGKSSILFGNSFSNIPFFQMVRKNVEKGKLGSAIVGLENKR